MKRILALLAAYTGFGLSMQYFLPTEQLLLDNLAQTISLNKAEEVLAQMVKYRWVGYVLTPLLLLLKWLFVAGLLYTALFFAQVEISFKKLWRVAVQAEWVFVLAALVKFGWFYFFATNYSLQDLQFFYPLSAANLFTPDELEAWWVYPFQIINLFEITYWLVLAILLGKLIQVSTDKAFEYVAKGYGTGLLLWVLLIVFITLNHSF